MLIECDECGRQISDQADACPNCGKKKATFLKTTTYTEKETQPAPMTVGTVVIIVIVVIIVLSIF